MAISEFIASGGKKKAGGKKAGESGGGQITKAIDEPVNSNVPLGLDEIGDDELSQEQIEKLNQAFTRSQQEKQRLGVDAVSAICDHYQKGEQWYYYDHHYRRVRMSEKLRNMFFNNDTMLNRVGENVDNIVAKQMANPIELEVVAGSGSDESRDRARASTALLRSWEESQNWRQLDKRLARWRLIFNKAYKRIIFDENVVTYVPFFVENEDSPEVNLEDDDFRVIDRRQIDGRWTDIVEGPFGDFRVEDPLLYEMYFEPGVYELDSASRFFTATLRSLTWVEETFGEEMRGEVSAEVINDSRALGGKGHLYTVHEYAHVTQGSRYTDEDGLLWIKTAYERKGLGWRRVIFVKSNENSEGVHLNSGEGVHSHHGYFEYSDGAEANTAWPRSMVWRAIPLQFEINYLKALQCKVNARSGKPYLLTTDNVQFSELDNCYVVKIPQLQNSTFSWHTIPNPTSPIASQLAVAESNLDRMMIIHDVSKGEVKGSTSGKAIDSLLREQQIGPDSLTRDTQRGNIKLAAEMLRMASKLYTEPRVIQLYDDQHDAQIVTSESILATSKVRPVISSLVPDTIGAKMALAKEFAGMRLFDEGNEVAAYRFFSYLDASPSELSRIVPAIQRVEHYAKTEHEAIEQGRIVVDLWPNEETGVEEPRALRLIDPTSPEGPTLEPIVRDFQEHAPEIIVHNRFRRTERYLEKWDQEQRAVLDQLVQDHTNFMAAQLDAVQQAPAEAAQEAPAEQQQAPQAEAAALETASAPLSDEAMIAAIANILSIEPEEATQLFTEAQVLASEFEAAGGAAFTQERVAI